MRTVIIMMICLQSVRIFGQTIGNELDSSHFIYMKCLEDYSSMIDSSNNLNSQFIGFKDSTANCVIFFDRKHQIFLKPFYHRNSEILSYFSLFDSKGKIMLHWYVASELSPTTLIVIELSHNNEIRYRVGMEKGGKSHFHGFSKRLFTQYPMELIPIDFNLCIDKLLKKYNKERR